MVALSAALFDVKYSRNAVASRVADATMSRREGRFRQILDASLVSKTQMGQT